jgi:hypothetical protein
VDYCHKIIKSMGVMRARNQSPPKKIDLRASKNDPLIEKYKQISNHPYANEIRALFDMGFSDLSANV